MSDSKATEPTLAAVKDPAQNEIDQIMNEIQELQREISGAPAEPPADVPPLANETPLPNEVPAPVVSLRPQSNPVSTDAKREGEFTVSVSGNMSLKLRYEFSGREVTLSFQDEHICVRTSDGMEIRIPTQGRERSSA